MRKAENFWHVYLIFSNNVVTNVGKQTCRTKMENMTNFGLAVCFLRGGFSFFSFHWAKVWMYQSEVKSCSVCCSLRCWTGRCCTTSPVFSGIMMWATGAPTAAPKETLQTDCWDVSATTPPTSLHSGWISQHITNLQMRLKLCLLHLSQWNKHDCCRQTSETKCDSK